MVDHRRTLSRRAYHLPGWFFLLTALACLAGILAVFWTLSDVGSDAESDRAQPAPATSAPLTTGPSTTAPSTAAAPRAKQPAKEPSASAQRSMKVQILNASAVHGLAKRFAEKARAAGWTTVEVGNWRYGAGHASVYFPDGSRKAARQLASDLGIESVEPAKAGMAADQLTVLVIAGP